MNYLYYDNQTGEYFYVIANSIDSADQVAYLNFEEPEFVCIQDDYKVEMMGYDTYWAQNKDY